MADHSEFVDLARELIAEDGRFITVQRLSAAPQDVAKPWNGPAEPTAAEQILNVPAVFLPAWGSAFGREIVSEDLLKLCSQVAMVSPMAEGMETMTSIEDTDGQRWKIVWAQAMKPAGQTILYLYGVSR